MKITIFGSGYVGLVTGTCLADVGHDVVCMDVDAAKIERLKQGEIPIYEPGLESMLLRNVEAGRLSFTTDAREAVAHGVLQFIAVGTPPDEDGSADLKYVLAVAESIGEYMDDYKVIIDKSTVPVGTADRVHARVAEVLKHRGVSVRFRCLLQPGIPQGGRGAGGLHAWGPHRGRHRFREGARAHARMLRPLQPQP